MIGRRSRTNRPAAGPAQPARPALVALAALVAVAGLASGCTVGGGRGASAPEPPPSTLGASLAAALAQVTAESIPPLVVWQPPAMPTDVAGLQTFLRTLVRCDDVKPLDQATEPGGFFCRSGGAAPGDRDYLYVLPLSSRDQALAGHAPSDAETAYAANYDGYRLSQYLVGKGKVDGYPVSDNGAGCYIVASAGPWSIQYVETHRLADEPTEFARVVTALDAVVHEDCAKPGLAPDTLALVGAMTGSPTCNPERVARAPLSGTTAQVVTWADYDVAFSCSNGYTMLRIPPGTADTFRRYDAEQVGCRPYVVVADRWLIHQSAITVMPATYDRSLLQNMASTFGARVQDPCST